MRNLIILVVSLLCLFTAALCSSLSIAFKYGYPCTDDDKHRQKTLMNCSYDMDCPENAYCWNRATCLCMNGYLVSSSKTKWQCLKIATHLGDPCREDVQCHVTFTVQAECRDNVCVCSAGSHYDEEQGRCYESVGLGQMCQTTYNCYVEGSSSFCVDGYCSCPLLHHKSIDGKRCIPSSFLGQKCRNDDECIVMHSQCDGTCTCKFDYVLSNDKKKCLRAAYSFGDLCEEDSQCKAFNAKCDEEKKCTCVSDFRRRGSVCLRKINPDMMGKHCSSRSQCVKPMPEKDLKEEEVVNVDCLNDKCSCAQDYILTEDKTDCIRFSENGARKTMTTWLLFIFIISRLINIV